MLYAIISALVALLGTILFTYRSGKKHGEKEVAAEQAKEVIHDLHVVKDARDLLARNKSVRDKLRDKYTR